MPVDPKAADELLARKADVYMPSAEGATGYPRDILALSVGALRELLRVSTNGTNGNGRQHAPAEADSSSDDSDG